MGRKPKAKTLESLRDALLEEAEQKGVSENYFFKTTFERYEMQLEIMKRLKEEIENSELIVTKKYGTKENEYINPAITEYNKTASAANGTVTTLVKILSNSGTSSEDTQPGAAIRDFCGFE